MPAVRCVWSPDESHQARRHSERKRGNRFNWVVWKLPSLYCIVASLSWEGCPVRLTLPMHPDDVIPTQKPKSADVETEKMRGPWLTWFTQFAGNCCVERMERSQWQVQDLGRSQRARGGWLKTAGSPIIWLSLVFLRMMKVSETKIRCFATNMSGFSLGCTIWSKISLMQWQRQLGQLRRSKRGAWWLRRWAARLQCYATRLQCFATRLQC